MRTRTFLLALLPLLAACSAPQRLHTASLAVLQSSLDAAQHQIFKKDLPTFVADRALFLKLYFPDGRTAASPKGHPDWRAVEGMTASEFHAFVHNTEHTYLDPLGKPQDFPSPQLARLLLDQYVLEKGMSEEARDQSQQAGKNTLDQYPLTDVMFIPPPVDAPVELDKTRVVFHFHNDSGYDAYKPVFHVVVSNPSDPAPLMDRVFDTKDRKTPIDPGADEPIELSCCDITSDPINNQLLKTLPSNARFEVQLVDVKDHNNASVLDTRGFDVYQLQRIGVVDRCIRILTAHLTTWVPPVNGQPECGVDQLDPTSAAAQSEQVQLSASRAIASAHADAAHAPIAPVAQTP